MVMTLKTKRRECGESMEKDKEEMAWIDKEIKQIMSLYKPLVQRLNERLETQAKVAKNLKLAEQTMQTLKGETKGTGKLHLLGPQESRHATISPFPLLLSASYLHIFMLLLQ